MLPCAAVCCRVCCRVPACCSVFCRALPWVLLRAAGCRRACWRVLPCAAWCAPGVVWCRARPWVLLCAAPLAGVGARFLCYLVQLQCAARLPPLRRFPWILVACQRSGLAGAPATPAPPLFARGAPARFRFFAKRLNIHHCSHERKIAADAAATLPSDRPQSSFRHVRGRRWMVLGPELLLLTSRGIFLGTVFTY